MKMGDEIIQLMSHMHDITRIGLGCRGRAVWRTERLHFAWSVGVGWMDGARWL
ncbi:hypothetical protein BX666DRAFT_1992648 [Dichotomocladium elegans]|nr:hypothetical protein BX666DRAFT_1992648 [Dichotomocladium elegans]